VKTRWQKTIFRVWSGVIVSGAVGLLLFIGCSSPTSPDFNTRVAQIWPNEQAVFAPDTVRVNTPFEIMVLTVICGCDRVGKDEIKMESPSHISVALMDSNFIGVGTCPSDCVRGEHHLGLNFSVPGEGVVSLSYIVGRPFGAEPMTEDISIFVLPE